MYAVLLYKWSMNKMCGPEILWPSNSVSLMQLQDIHKQRTGRLKLHISFLSKACSSGLYCVQYGTERLLSV